MRGLYALYSVRAGGEKYPEYAAVSPRLLIVPGARKILFVRVQSILTELVRSCLSLYGS